MDITIKPTYHCNLACTYCCIHQFGARRLPELSAEDAIRALGIAAGHTRKTGERVTVKWHGGEPLTMGASFFERVFAWQDAQDVPFDNAVFTNLMLLDDNVARLFRSHGVHVYTSLDTTDPAHDAQRGGHCTEVMRRLGELAEAGYPQITVKSTVTAQNVGDLPQTYAYLSTLPFEWNLGPVFPSGRASDGYAGIMPDPRVFTDVACAIFDDWAARYPIDIYLFNQVIEELLSPTPAHAVCRPMFNVDPFGDLYRCPQLHGAARYRMGRFDDPGAADAFRAQTCEWSRYHAARCEGCPYTWICRFNHCSYLGDSLALVAPEHAERLCDTLKPLFDHIAGALKEQLDAARLATSPELGRNTDSLTSLQLS